MNGNKLNFLLIILIIVGIVLSKTLFTVKQTESAIVVRFGEPIRVIKEPGLKMKTPFMEDVLFFDNRLLDIELSELEITLGDRRRIIVDAFGRYKITDPLLFFQTVKNEIGVKARLSAIVLGSLRSILGSFELSSLLSDERIKIMENIKNLVNESAKSLGINVIDVRIRRTDLPQQNSDAIFKRMISERQREAKELRAKGQEQSMIIKSEADKEATIMLSEARKKANILQGEAEGEANKIYANAYSKDPEFFEFYKSMEAYKSSLTERQSFIKTSENNESKLIDIRPKLIINPRGAFFRYFK